MVDVPDGADAPIIGITGYAESHETASEAPTFVLAQSYVQAVLDAGGAPIILPAHLDRPALRSICERVDGLILSGGGDVHPSFFGQKDGGALSSVDEGRDRTELALARWAMAQDVPLLAICRGIQVLNIAAGGTLIQDIAAGVEDALEHSSVGRQVKSEIAHTVEVSADTRLASLVGSGTLDVNSFHNQAVQAVGEGLVVTARAPDGVIEGLEAPGLSFCIGVQWHPERLVEGHPAMRRLFEALVAAAQ
ncbi:MAG: gamma-glutamyl-gamma-aminobutyrate hydrolase family protein [Chloroflexota bacterium]|nr:gamma-glutamyl-gamma-aminobutyrate hydrolase family protein [Chloroflexota bacterium]